MSLTPLDFVLYKGEDGKHMAGGFEVQPQHGGSVQSVILTGLKNLAVPAVLFFLQQNAKKNYQVINKDGSDKLIKIITKSCREVIATKGKSFLKLIL